MDFRMFTTIHGAFNGTTWEALCQQVFKSRYFSEGYHPIPASPGDFGLEGFTLDSGCGFQCYCPDKQPSSDELYVAQRDKITEDLKKLRTFEKALSEILGATRLSKWVFVTPQIGRHALLRHARKKEREVRAWGLSILTDDFSVHLHDGDFYLHEINVIRAESGEALIFGDEVAELPALDEPAEIYEQNLLRKSRLRLNHKSDDGGQETRVLELYHLTLKNFLETDVYLKQISDGAPTLYFKLKRLINEFEQHVVEAKLTWSGSPHELTENLKQALAKRIGHDLRPEVDETTAAKISRHMVARWLAICSLDYE